jgi:hypothetical protein
MGSPGCFGRWLVLSTLICVAPATAVAGTPADSVEHLVAANVITSTASAHDVSIVPRINRHVTGSVRSKIEAGFRLALQRVNQVPACADLFAALGADGTEVLSTTLYYGAELKMEMRVCPGALAYTLVGGAPTWLCRRFARLSDERAAAILLHEALHHAGMDEWPHDPQAAPASAINELVEDACQF